AEDSRLRLGKLRHSLIKLIQTGTVSRRLTAVCCGKAARLTGASTFTAKPLTQQPLAIARQSAAVTEASNTDCRIHGRCSENRKPSPLGGSGSLHFRNAGDRQSAVRLDIFYYRHNQSPACASRCSAMDTHFFHHRAN